MYIIPLSPPALGAASVACRRPMPVVLPPSNLAVDYLLAILAIGRAGRRWGATETHRRLSRLVGAYKGRQRFKYKRARSRAEA